MKSNNDDIEKKILDAKIAILRTDAQLKIMEIENKLLQQLAEDTTLHDNYYTGSSFAL